MAACRFMAENHLLLWLVPAAVGALLAGIGSRLGRRWIAALAVGGALFPLLQASLACGFVLWGATAEDTGPVQFRWLTGGVAGLRFALDGHGLWAILLACALALAAQLAALSTVARFAGRHRFHALILLMAASSGFLCTSRDPVGTLIGWEGLGLAGSLLAGFWTLEHSGARTGIRFLLFQRLSGVVLLVGTLVANAEPAASVALIVAAACIRAGQVPFHGWVPDSGRAPAPAAALIHGVASWLPAVYLLGRVWYAIVELHPLPEILLTVGLAGIALGVLSALQQHDPRKSLGWLFTAQASLTVVEFAMGDPVAAQVSTTGGVLILGAWTLAAGGSRVAPDDPQEEAPRRLPAFVGLLLAAAWLLPPSLGFIGNARLLGFLEPGWQAWLVRLGVGWLALGGGWVLFEAYRSMRPPITGNSPVAAGTRWTVFGAGVVALGFGVLGMGLNGWDMAGRAPGVLWSLICSALGLLGWGLGMLRWRLRGRVREARLSSAERWMDRVADTGMGIGEVVVQVPIIIVQGLGVIVWRVVGDLVVDGLVLGLGVRTVEGIGLALRYFQNGRIQRYALISAVAALALAWLLLGG